MHHGFDIDAIKPEHKEAAMDYIRKCLSSRLESCIIEMSLMCAKRIAELIIEKGCSLDADAIHECIDLTEADVKKKKYVYMDIEEVIDSAKDVLPDETLEAYRSGYRHKLMEGIRKALPSYPRPSERQGDSEETARSVQAIIESFDTDTALENAA